MANALSLQRASTITPSPSGSLDTQQGPNRRRVITLFAIAIILFSSALSVGTMGLAAKQSALPLWLKSVVTLLGKRGCMGVIAGGYVASSLLAAYARMIHTHDLLRNEEQIQQPKTTCEKMLETATRIPRMLFSTVIEVGLLPVAGILLLLSCYRSNYDSSHPKKDKIPILQIHGSNFCEIVWVASWPWLNKKEYGSIFTVNLDGLITNKHSMGIDDYAKGKMRDKIREIKQLTGQNEVILIGYSMGGLVAAYYVENCAAEEGVTVKHVISIATPWHGAPILHCKNEITKPKRYKQMTEHNAFLTDLVKKALETNEMKKCTYYCIGSTTDVIAPGASSILTRNHKNNKMYSWLGHCGIIAYPGTWLAIRSLLDLIYKG